MVVALLVVRWWLAVGGKMVVATGFNLAVARCW